MISQYFFILQFQDHIALIIHLPFGSRVFNKKVKIQKLFTRIKLLGAKKILKWPFLTWKKTPVGFSLNSDLQKRGVFYFIIYSKLLRTWLTWMSKFVSQLHDTLQNYCNYALNGILFPKLFWATVKKKCFSDLENFLSLEQFIQTVKDQFNFWNWILF